MGRIFGVLNAGHAWCQTLDTWIGAIDDPQHAIGANIAVDMRVPPKRQGWIETFRPELPLKEQLNKYTVSQQTAAVPDFIRCPENLAERVPADKDLVWIVDLTALYPVGDMIEKVEERLDKLRPNGQAASTTTSHLGDAAFYWNERLELSGHIPEGTICVTGEQLTETHRAVMGCLLDELRENRKWRRHPIWVCLYEELRHHLEKGPERWLELVGVPKSSGNRHIAVVKYPKGDLPLFRPSTADAFSHSYHFPTSMTSDPNEGGRSLDMSGPISTIGNGVEDNGSATGVGSRDNPPLREYIHMHGFPAAAQLVAIGRTGRPVGPEKPYGTEVIALRKHHTECLMQVCPLQVCP